MAVRIEMLFRIYVLIDPRDIELNVGLDHLDPLVLYLNTYIWYFRHDEVIEVEEVSVYDIKDHAYAKFRLGHVFVRVESAQVCLAASR